jgi:hypothetical protein
MISRLGIRIFTTVSSCRSGVISPRNDSNHQLTTYLTVTLEPHSPYSTQPSLLSYAHPSLTFIGQVGELEDVQLFSVPKANWEQEGVKDDIFAKLLGNQSVKRVDVLPEPVKRHKRGKF